MTEPYDSTADTLAHITRVRLYLLDAAVNLNQRGVRHDASKLVSPEKEAFDLLTPRLKGLAYGSDEYRACLRELKPALDHHYAENSHHPEHYGELGVAGMSLFDALEMLLDWKAASERHDSGDIRQSLEINHKRFHLSDQLTMMLGHTITEMGW
jgi:hypothetical protein